MPCQRHIRRVRLAGSSPVRPTLGNPAWLGETRSQRSRFPRFVPNTCPMFPPRSTRCGPASRGSSGSGSRCVDLDLTLCLGCSGPGSASGHGLEMSSGSPKGDCGPARIVPAKGDREHPSGVPVAGQVLQQDLDPRPSLLPKVTPPEDQKPRPRGDKGFARGPNWTCSARHPGERLHGALVSSNVDDGRKRANAASLWPHPSSVVDTRISTSVPKAQYVLDFRESRWHLGPSADWRCLLVGRSDARTLMPEGLETPVDGWSRSLMSGHGGYS